MTDTLIIILLVLILLSNTRYGSAWMTRIDNALNYAQKWVRKHISK